MTIGEIVKHRSVRIAKPDWTYAVTYTLESGMHLPFVSGSHKAFNGMHEMDNPMMQVNVPKVIKPMSNQRIRRRDLLFLIRRM